MADSKKYYYLKLKDSFFDREDIKLLEAMENGYRYSNLYLKLCLRSLQDEGRLMFKGVFPYDEPMISTITGHDIDTVRCAMKVLKRMQFITVLDNNAIFIQDIHSLIGTGSSEGERKAMYRARMKQEELGFDDLGQSPGHFPPELEINLEKEIEKEIKKPVKHRYGEYKHVLLTDDEYNSLPEKVDDREFWIKQLDEGIENKGYTFKNHSLTMQNWYKKEQKKHSVPTPSSMSEIERIMSGGSNEIS